MKWSLAQIMYNRLFSAKPCLTPRKNWEWISDYIYIKHSTHKKVIKLLIPIWGYYVLSYKTLQSALYLSVISVKKCEFLHYQQSHATHHKPWDMKKDHSNDYYFPISVIAGKTEYLLFMDLHFSPKEMQCDVNIMRVIDYVWLARWAH